MSTDKRNRNRYWYTPQCLEIYVKNCIVKNPKLHESLGEFEYRLLSQLRTTEFHYDVTVTIRDIQVIHNFVTFRSSVIAWSRCTVRVDSFTVRCCDNAVTQPGIYIHTSVERYGAISMWPSGNSSIMIAGLRG